MKKYSLKTSLYRLFASSVMIPFILTSLLIFLFSQKESLNNYRENNQIILQSVTNHLESSIRSFERFFYQYLFDADIANFYQFVNKNDYEESREKLYKYIRYSSKYREALNNYMTIFYDYHKGIGFVTNSKRKYSCYYLMKYSDRIVEHESEEVEKQDWFLELKELPLGKVMFLEGSLEDQMSQKETAEGCFTMIRVINHIETANRLGYAFLEVSDSVFSDLAKEFILPEGAGLTICFPNGNCVYTTDEKFVSEMENSSDEKGVSQEKIKINGETFFRYSMLEDRYGFQIHYMLPQNLVLQQAYRTSTVILCIWACAFLIAFIIYMQLSNQISVSTDKIIQYINRYRIEHKKDSEQIMSTMQISEFDDISKALVEMTERNTTLIRQEYIMKMNQQMAEYKAMQAEINPHFFNNVMNSLMALNRIGDTKKLEYGIRNLSKMFRYTCEHGYETTISQECDFIESYLMLEKIRFEERLEYKINIEPEVQDFSIPKLLLQPIIENAMHHGMPQDGSSMTILVTVSCINGAHGNRFVWIVIANDGIPYKNDEVTGKGRVGITNVRERLTLTYPDSFFWYDRNSRFKTICNMLIRREE